MSRVAGGILGFVVGGVLACQVFCVMVCLVTGTNSVSTSEMTTASFLIFYFGPVAALVGAIVGAVVGVKIASPKRSDKGRSLAGKLCWNCGCTLAGGSKTCKWCGAELE